MKISHYYISAALVKVMSFLRMNIRLHRAPRSSRLELGQEQREVVRRKVLLEFINLFLRLTYL
jgi:hypothetical protein